MLYMHECVYAWMYVWNFYDCTTVDVIRLDRRGGSWTDIAVQTLGKLHRRDIIVNKSGYWWYETWHTVAADAPWEASSLTIEGLGEVAICKWEQSVLPLACFISHSLFLFVEIPNFCLDYPFGFSVHREYIPFCAPNFCLDRPFGISVHRDALYCLSRLFRFSA